MKMRIDSFKKYLAVSCTTILLLGVQGPANRKIASIANNCPNQQTGNSLLDVISKLVASQNVITEQVDDGTSVFNPHLYSKNGFFLHSDFSYATYSPPAFNSEFTTEQLDSYNSKVEALAKYREDEAQAAWSPSFDEEGELTNPFYGFGPETAQGIKQMFQFPTAANPIFNWSPEVQTQPQVAEQPEVAVYYPQTSAI